MNSASVQFIYASNSVISEGSFETRNMSSRLQNTVRSCSMACEKALVILLVSLCSSWCPRSEAADGEGSVGCVYMPCPQLLAGGLRVS